MAQTTAMHLPAEILAEMLPRVLGRLLSRELRARIDASVTSVRLRPGTPAAVLRKLVLQECRSGAQPLSACRFAESPA